MSKKILLVDDEQSVLNGIERRLGLDYELLLANSGEKGLQVIQQDTPIAVIVSDMRMPQMDGVEFLKKAKEASPDSVSIMLTGNQDQLTAIQAVNEGQVFRFLNKPCSHEHLRNALDAALRQYELITGEKELLQKTFCGAVSVLAEVLEISHPSIFSRSAGIHDFVQAMRKRVGLEDRWEYKLASKLSLLGFALLPESQLIQFDHSVPCITDNMESMTKASEIGQRLIEKIPRLKMVAHMIGNQPHVDGSLRTLQPKENENIIRTGATLLRAALLAECLSRQGICAMEGTRVVQDELPLLGREFLSALEDSWPESVDLPTLELSLDELEEEMILAEDVVPSDGAVLLRKGRRLTTTIIERLRCHQGKFKRSTLFKVYEQDASDSETKQVEELIY